MMHEWLRILLLESAFLAVLVIGEVMARTISVHPEIPRKLVHAGMCLVALAAPAVTTSPWVVAGATLFGFFVLYAGVRTGTIRSVHSAVRSSAGGYSLLGAIGVCYWIAISLNDNALFYIPILVTGLADSAAGLTGQLFAVRQWPAGTSAGHAGKTYAGSLVFFGITFGIILAWVPGFYHLRQGLLLVTCLVTGLACTLTEAFSGRKFDNLTVPGVTLLVLLLLRQFV